MIYWQVALWRRISRRQGGAFFHYDSLGSFQGDINPLSTRSVIDTCVMPVLMYGCENWILTDKSLPQTRVLSQMDDQRKPSPIKWPQRLSTTDALVALGRELEAVYSLKLTDTILGDAQSVHLQDIKKEVLLADKTMLLDLCTMKSLLITELEKLGGSWPVLWDTVRHLGSHYTIGLQHLSRMLSQHGRGPKPCPLCDDRPLLTAHVLTQHKDDINLPNLTPLPHPCLCNF